MLISLGEGTERHHRRKGFAPWFWLPLCRPPSRLQAPAVGSCQQCSAVPWNLLQAPPHEAFPLPLENRLPASSTVWLFCHSMSQGYVLTRLVSPESGSALPVIPILVEFSLLLTSQPPLLQSPAVMILILDLPCSNYCVVSLSWLGPDWYSISLFKKVLWCWGR